MSRFVKNGGRKRNEPFLLTLEIFGIIENVSRLGKLPSKEQQFSRTQHFILNNGVSITIFNFSMTNYAAQDSLS